MSSFPALYEEYSRSAWSALAQRSDFPLTGHDLTRLASLGDPIDLAEANIVYRPLSALLNLQVQGYRTWGRQRREFLSSCFAGLSTQTRENETVPYVIGIAGSVAVGKSTTARLLQQLLSRLPSTPKVDLVTTDGFLYPNAELEKRGLMARKGFPESYDRKALINFLAAVKSGESPVKAPLYSHITYDVLPGVFQTVDRPDILIIEGINVLQPPHSVRHPDLSLDRNLSLTVSDFFDFSIYVDADVQDIQRWYVERFMRLKYTAFTNPESYFKVYADVPDDAARQIALDIWNSVNLPNLEGHILPTRGRAHLIIHKGPDHKVRKILVRKI